MSHFLFCMRTAIKYRTEFPSYGELSPLHLRHSPVHCMASCALDMQSQNCQCVCAVASADCHRQVCGEQSHSAVATEHGRKPDKTCRTSYVRTVCISPYPANLHRMLTPRSQVCVSFVLQSFVLFLTLCPVLPGSRLAIRPPSGAQAQGRM